MGQPGSIPGSGRSHGEEKPTPVFFPGEFHGQRSLADYSRWGCKESDVTGQLTHTHKHQKSPIHVSLTTVLHGEKEKYTIARTWKQLRCPSADE